MQKQIIAFNLSLDVIEFARQEAKKENRNLSNYIETLIIRERTRKAEKLEDKAKETV